MIKINKEKFFYAIIIIMVIDLIIDGVDDFGTRLYLIHLIRNIVIIGISLILSISFKKP
jgi:hypothetical protein